MIVNLKDKKAKYSLGESGEFIIENYNFAKPFANFFPGIAGKYGIPMWTFYVNRGQGISSFGIKDKDHAILEFFPANKSWQLTSTYGFRTFIKLVSGKKIIFYEPFHNGLANLEFSITNRMSISSHGLIIEEENSTLGLNVKVEYFNIPNDSYAGLARIVTIRNLSRLKKKIQLLDGLPQIVPFGTSNLFLKKLGRTIEAWMNVENLNKNAPFYKLSVDPTDRPEVIHIKEGNFFLGFHYKGLKPEVICPVVDPACVFGAVTDFSCPREFLSGNNFKPPKNQSITSKMPSGFLPLNISLSPSSEKTFYSVTGYMRSRQILNSSISKITAPGYLAKKKEENIALIEGLKQDITTKSSSHHFDLYAKQTYLDNILRGGYPVVFKSAGAFYLYSRKHGDLERDYNKFQLQPTYFSQGNGNYRDINQNRRCDTWFNPDIKDENLVYFFNLLQSDGFNPLVVKGVSFILKSSVSLSGILKGVAEEKGLLKLSTFFKKPFSPGELIFFLEENNIKINRSYDELLDLILSNSDKQKEAEHGEGFWTDHWTYNLDLLQAYLSIYPERLKSILFEDKIFTFFDNTEVVRPRHEKYVLKDGQVRQLHALAADAHKKELIRKRAVFSHVTRAQYGAGEIYNTTLINKLLCLVVNKLSSLDPFGVGIEMEADKPNWFDSLNGLPALFGSSLCETLELKRLVIFIKETLAKTEIKDMRLTEEVHAFLVSLDHLLKENLRDTSSNKDYEYWDRSYSLKEEYRHKTKLGFSGNETEMPTAQLEEILDNALDKLDRGIKKAKSPRQELYYSYFINKPKDFKPVHEHFVKPTEFSQIKVPLFLEGQVHALKLARNPEEARSIYKATKISKLYDKKLKMYKVTAPLESMPEEIGRCRVFTPGWLENESIWLHMEYKYMLELLKSGLYEEFYTDFKNVFIPFQRPERYGRNILENSSFLVSSAFPDKNLRGNGFVARLSGSTAEFLQIWLLMNAGQEPFFLDNNGQLNLAFKPALPGWLFDKKGLYSFNFLSKIPVTYHNPGRKNTFGKNAAKITKIVISNANGQDKTISSGIIPSPWAEKVRLRQITGIDIYLD